MTDPLRTKAEGISASVNKNGAFLHMQKRPVSAADGVGEWDEGIPPLMYILYTQFMARIIK